MIDSWFKFEKDRVQESVKPAFARFKEIIGITI